MDKKKAKLQRTSSNLHALNYCLLLKQMLFLQLATLF